MLKEWNKNYQELMYKSRLASQFGAFWLVTAGLLELFRLWKALYDNAPVDAGLCNRSLTESVLGALIIGSLVVRSIVVQRRLSLRFGTICVSWLLPSLALFFYWANYNHFWSNVGSSFEIYEINRPDLILGHGLLFVVLSGVRFTMTASVALFKTR